jgi:hypothetical protein
MATRNYRKLTAEDEARHERIMAMTRERIAYHEAKAREVEERRAQRGLLNRIRRSLRAARAAW